MRAAIADRGLEPLVSIGGKSVAEKMIDELNTRDTTLDDYDPLMGMHWAIAGNVMDLLGQSAGYLLFGDGETPEDPIDVSQIKDRTLREKFAGKTWSRCPLCYINVAHEISCRESRCRLARVDGYDWMIARAADDAKAKVDELMRGKK
jgi:hypothetical protein